MSKNDQSEFKVGDTVWYWERDKLKISTSKIAVITRENEFSEILNLENGLSSYGCYMYLSREECIVFIKRFVLDDVNENITYTKGQITNLSNEFLDLTNKRDKIVEAIK